MAIDKALEVLIALDTRKHMWQYREDEPQCPNCGDQYSYPANDIDYSVWRRCCGCNQVWENDY